MKNHGYKYLLLAGLWACLFAIARTQPISDSLLVRPALVLKNLPDATAMEVDPEGNLILLEAQAGRLHKFFINTDYDSAISIGGKSGRQEGFLHLAGASARNRQHIYLLDDLARRIVLLSTDFQIVGEIDFFSSTPAAFIDAAEIYPKAFDTSIAGETFVLNQLDNRVYKIDLTGELRQQFGGLDYGQGSLVHPVDIALSDENDVWVSDTLAQAFQVFDYFGVFRYQKPAMATFRWGDFSLYGSLLVYWNARNIGIEHLHSGRKREYPFSATGPIRDVKLSKDFIYLLLEKEIRIYRWN